MPAPFCCVLSFILAPQALWPLSPSLSILPKCGLLLRWWPGHLTGERQERGEWIQFDPGPAWLSVWELPSPFLKNPVFLDPREYALKPGPVFCLPRGAGGGCMGRPWEAGAMGGMPRTCPAFLLHWAGRRGAGPAEICDLFLCHTHAAPRPGRGPSGGSPLSSQTFIPPSSGHPSLSPPCVRLRTRSLRVQTHPALLSHLTPSETEAQEMTWLRSRTELVAPLDGAPGLLGSSQVLSPDSLSPWSG